MGRRAKGKNKLTVSRADSIRTLVLVIIVTVIPVLGTVFVTASSSEADLSELSPISHRAGNYVVLEWAALLQDHPSVLKVDLGIPAGAEVQALGYMMDGDRSIGKGEQVQEFVLQPEAGNLLHPAHRIRDQMIAVHLEDGTRIPFSPRALVWVWGEFRLTERLGTGSEAIYLLERARAKAADRAEIKRYFK